MDVDPPREETPKVPKRHDFLWFPDGNVVLATDASLFKVHKSLLAVHSSVFRDMFELPNVGHAGVVPGRDDAGLASEAYEGVPMVTLVGDKGEDVAHLLRAVFEPNTKYDFNTVRKNVILHISRNYPKTLREYDALYGYNSPMFGKRRTECHFPLLAAAVTAEVDVLLPSLFLACSELDINEIIRQSQSITLETLRILIDGRERLAYVKVEIVDTLSQQLRTMDANGECQNEVPCLQDACFIDIQDFVISSLGDIVGEQVVRYYLSPVCKGCGSFMARMVDEERKGKWDDMPSHFDSEFAFTDWKELKAKLKAILES
ncbi:hypothetical protein SCHPADRAFT_945039 [Schizopora paradoxa]|uniref:BTB domain-containing protein n=1 Tax=Schizopora paradoxa TaxID=27342 RepID=A0A0H2RDY4_9AGAM|nr:hypothetical protein SCHPADRAFT_945039 [Schizopora paradoxa]